VRQRCAHLHFDATLHTFPLRCGAHVGVTRLGDARRVGETPKQVEADLPAHHPARSLVAQRRAVELPSGLDADTRQQAQTSRAPDVVGQL
jgi:hypothetical protein